MDRLTNVIRPYSWGSRTALPELLGTEPTGEPQAELWMGAHPGAPSTLDRGNGPRPLDAVIDANPEGELGTETLARFGPTLPFLLKILAAGEPLSLQVHPDLARARSGFADEEARGIPLDAFGRNYKDANHKPELICALGDFVGLCGFRRPAETARLLEALAVPALLPLARVLREQPEAEALRAALTAVLTTDAETMATTVRQTTEALAQAAKAVEAGDLTGSALAELPASIQSSLGSYAAIGRFYPEDAGVVAALLLNHIRLASGEALFLGAGIPHAYLNGLGVEILANSDNVLRCGLTPKHVDIPELLEVVDFRSTDPDILRPVLLPDADGEELYSAPIDEFRLSRFTLGGAAPQHRRVSGATPQILLCTEGTAVLTDAEGSAITLHPGESAFVPAGGPDPLIGSAVADTRSTVFRATVSV
ncbi:mannose-6-phosphate isomerase, class I [Streptacidiphilus sp. P02-A3a]|uniref:mannose-6-phosphate isomerase, class I n=1 Tax=Streptacidiphilus sp. P02-A3a TaxID=2704468 RepID=UPI0015F8D378|nr:mannose-6-phosphate isomerase, class I [Streptacidiphilus sp. P02-A3a]QMU67861.1 mannose-6-phosphate isomerase, class I [Streptacidiphilus sp. P02-A3a]